MSLRLSIRKKILGGILTGVLSGIGIGVIGLYGVQTLDSALHHMGTNRVPSLILLQNIDQGRARIRSYRYEILATAGDETRVADLTQIKTDYQQTFASIDKYWADLLKIPRTTEEGKRLLGEITLRFTAWRKSSQEVMDRYMDLLVRGEAGETLDALYDEYENAMKNINAETEAFSSALQVQADQNNRTLYDLITKNEALGNRLILTSILVMILGSGTALVLGVVIANHIVNPIKYVFSRLKAMSEGI